MPERLPADREAGGQRDEDRRARWPRIGSAAMRCIQDKSDPCLSAHPPPLGSQTTFMQRPAGTIRSSAQPSDQCRQPVVRKRTRLRHRPQEESRMPRPMSRRRMRLPRRAPRPGRESSRPPPIRRAPCRQLQAATPCPSPQQTTLAGPAPRAERIARSRRRSTTVCAMTL